LVCFPQRTNDRQFHVSCVPRRSDDIEGALRHGLKTKFPLSGSRRDYDARNSMVAVTWPDQVEVRTIRQVFIAKNDFNRLRGKHFFGLCSRDAYNDVGRERLKLRSKERRTSMFGETIRTRICRGTVVLPWIRLVTEAGLVWVDREGKREYLR